MNSNDAGPRTDAAMKRVSPGGFWSQEHLGTCVRSPNRTALEEFLVGANGTWHVRQDPADGWLTATLTSRAPANGHTVICYLNP